MPRTCEGAAREGPPQDDQVAAKLTTSPHPVSNVAHGVSRPADELAVRRELRSWAAAAGWLNGHGYAAAVPGHVADALSGRGLVVWAAGGRRAA